MRIGYGRVTARDQDPDSQRDALAAVRCQEILIDEAGGKSARGPALDQALDAARAGDQLVVTTLDRLGRSLEHLTAVADDLQAKGVDLVVLDPAIDTSTTAGAMFFQILGAIADFEHASMSERTRAGLDAARAQGRIGGQQPKLTARQAALAQAMYAETGPDGRSVYTVQQIAEHFGVTRPTIYRHLQPRPH